MFNTKPTQTNKIETTILKNEIDQNKNAGVKNLTRFVFLCLYLQVEA